MNFCMTLKIEIFDCKNYYILENILKASRISQGNLNYPSKYL